jgi:hypothetical protein
MARNRRAALRRLTVEQETVMSSWGNLLSGEKGESNLDTAVRLFGSAEAARAAWYGHRDALLAADPVPGRRPAGWWLFDRDCDVPPVALQPDLLRQLGELTADEEATLEQWRRMTPEPPADLALDHQSTTERRTPLIAILEEPDHAIDAPPEPPRPAVTEADAGSDAPSEDPEAEDPGAKERERTEENVVNRPRILSVPWPLQNGNPNDGWETD